MSEYDNLQSQGDDEFEEPAPLLLPLDAFHRERGGRMVEFAGYMMPVQYTGEWGGIMPEHLWTRSHAGLFDVSHMGQLGISADAPDTDLAAAVEAVLPIDLSTLKPGRVRYSLLLDENGGILDDLMVTNTGKDFALVVNGATKWDDIAHLREGLADEVTLTHFDEQALLALQGPEAATAFARLGLKPLHDDVLPVTDLKFMQAGIYDWNGVRLGVSRSGYTGEDGYEISVPAQSAVALADALCAQPEVKPIGLGARDSLRLEAGLPLYGHDLSPETSPIEADLGFGINKRRRAEGGFPGAARIQGELTAGAPRKRVGLTLEGRQAAREGAVVYAGKQEVGVLTSGGFSPTLQRPIAMAYVLSEHAGEGTALQIDVRGKRLPASVTPMPFVPHRYHR